MHRGRMADERMTGKSQPACTSSGGGVAMPRNSRAGFPGRYGRRILAIAAVSEGFVAPVILPPVVTTGCFATRGLVEADREASLERP